MRTDQTKGLDSVRLALPRSPESGLAVSTHAETVSREKTQNVVGVLGACLFVVVTFRQAASHLFSAPQLLFGLLEITMSNATPWISCGGCGIPRARRSWLELRKS